jgi:DNA-binding NarL/FixJ family response regulator
LSTRETEILRLVIAGYRNRDIAHQLSISESTVKNHLSNIFDKLGIYSRRDLNSVAL